MELSFPRTFTPGSESSIGGTLAPWIFRSLELSSPGTFAAESENDVELSLPNTISVDQSVIYTDFKKAFDEVPHNRLISQLGSYGIDQALVNSPYAHQNLFSWLHMVSKMTKFEPCFLQQF